MTTTLVLGGARSGKSAFAEKLALETRQPVNYIATAQAEDKEMRRRIERHRKRRPVDWNTHETPSGLAGYIAAISTETRSCIIVDCLGLWLSNLILVDDEDMWQVERKALLDLLPKLQSTLILVGSETGLGNIAMDPLTRRFNDEAGLLHQEIAQQADRVVLVVAGLPHTLKG